ncbi:MAG TPA: hypothetical protein VNE63_14595 [Candidatus Acidoferrales bacterium]|nr:hypothetical protein [Candidatus Acidoferrales bacterium]
MAQAPPMALHEFWPGNRAPREHRKVVRYALQARVVFSWVDRDGVTQQGQGCTRDISTRGAYVHCSGWPHQGASIAMSIYIPLLMEEGRFLRIQTEGCVMRVEPAIGVVGECGGFSVQTDRVTEFADERVVR